MISNEKYVYGLYTIILKQDTKLRKNEKILKQSLIVCSKLLSSAGQLIK